MVSDVVSLRADITKVESSVVFLTTAVKRHTLRLVGLGVADSLAIGGHCAFFAVQVVEDAMGLHLLALPGTKVVPFMAGMSFSNFIEPCCGMGGISLGLQECGFSPVAAMDISGLSARTYSQNHDIAALEGNILEADQMARLLTAAGSRSCGLAVGFPCPPFSSRGDQIALGILDLMSLFSL